MLSGPESRACINIKHGIIIIFVWLALTVKQQFCAILVANNPLPGHAGNLENSE